MEEVINDYERSFLGSFLKILMILMKGRKDIEMFLSFTKFQNDLAFSLVQGDNANLSEVEYIPSPSPKVPQ